jgi:hypothetical protein
MFGMRIVQEEFTAELGFAVIVFQLTGSGNVDAFP